ncbi:class I SAM-dependent methyltransferase [Planctomycetota bacterium]
MSNKPKGYYDNVRDDMLKYIPANVETVLEFGCGSGAFSALVKDEFVTESWAVEIDQDSAQTAAKKLDKVLCCDAFKAIDQLPDDFFNCIIFFDMLEHVVDPYSLLTAVKTKLTEKGVIVMSIPNVRYYRNLVNFTIHGNWDYKDHGILDKTHLRFFTRNSLVKIFKELDFEIIQIEGIHPTSSRTFKLLNLLFLNFFSDVRHKHFAIVAKPNNSST